MSKAVIFLALFVAIASAHFLAPTPKDFSALFSGFNQQLAIASDDDFNKCANVPLIADIEKLFQDLNADKPNPIALVADVTKLYTDYQKVKVACPQLARTYEAFFADFEHSVETNPKGTALKVAINVFKGFKDLRSTAAKLHADLSAKNYYSVGADLGTIVQISLAGFV